MKTNKRISSTFTNLTAKSQLHSVDDLAHPRFGINDTSKI
jgi:hypothetical protein